MQETDRSMHGENEIEETAEGPQELSTEPLLNLKPEVSVSMSLIDESAQHLLELQKSCGADLSGQQRAERNPQVINAACNCAKQIAQLLRLKLDAVMVLKSFDEV